MWAKRSVAGKEWRESKGEPGAHFIDLFYSIWTKEWEKKVICGLHFQQAVNTYFLDKIHDISAHLRGEIQVQACVLEQREIDTVSEMIEVGNKYTEEEMANVSSTYLHHFDFYSPN